MGAHGPGRLRVVLGAPGRRPFVVRCPVLEASPGAKVAWAAGIPGATWLPHAVRDGRCRRGAGRPELVGVLTSSTS